MPNCSYTCPFAATTISFNAYVITTDFEYIPDSGEPAKQIQIHYRFECPQAFIARASAIREVRRIKCIMEKGLPDPDAKYQYEGIELWMEYQIA